MTSKAEQLAYDAIHDYRIAKEERGDKAAWLAAEGDATRRRIKTIPQTVAFFKLQLQMAQIAHEQNHLWRMREILDEVSPAKKIRPEFLRWHHLLMDAEEVEEYGYRFHHRDVPWAARWPAKERLESTFGKIDEVHMVNVVNIDHENHSIYLRSVECITRAAFEESITLEEWNNRTETPYRSRPLALISSDRLVKICLPLGTVYMFGFNNKMELEF